LCKSFVTLFLIHFFTFPIIGQRLGWGKSDRLQSEIFVGASSVNEMNPQKVVFSKNVQAYPIIKNEKKRYWVKFTLSSKSKEVFQLSLRNNHNSDLFVLSQLHSESNLKAVPIEEAYSEVYFTDKLGAGESKTYYISAISYLPYISFPMFYQDIEHANADRARRSLLWGIYIGILLSLSITIMVMSMLLKIKPYFILSLWSIAMTLMFTWQGGHIFTFLGYNFSINAKTVVYFFLRGMTILLFLVFIRQVTIFESRGKSFFKKVFTSLLWMVGLSQMLFLVFGLNNPQWVREYQHVFLYTFWTLTISAFGLTVIWLVKPLKKNGTFGLIILTFFLPFMAFLISNANNYYGLTSIAIEVPKSYFIGFSIQLIVFVLFILDELKHTIVLSNNLEIKVFNPQSEGRKGMDNLLLLTPRENEIFKAYCNGFTYQEISNAFFISPNTVRTHLKNIYKKLNINSKAEGIHLIGSLSKG
jgi:DNA-binding CsgD family transcriptional regulator